MFVKNLTIKETANILGSTRNKFFDFLRKEKIMLYTNGRNLPADQFIRQGWFHISYMRVDKENFSALCPVIRVTQYGFDKLKERFDRLNRESGFLNTMEDQIEKNLITVMEVLRISREELDQRLTHVKKTNLIGDFIIDNNTPNQSIVLSYDYTKMKIWQKINNSQANTF